MSEPTTAERTLLTPEIRVHIEDWAKGVPLAGPSERDMRDMLNDLGVNERARVRLEEELAPWKQEFPNWDTLEVAKRIQDLEAEVRMARQDRDDRETELGEAREALEEMPEVLDVQVAALRDYGDTVSIRMTVGSVMKHIAKRARAALAPKEAEEPMSQDKLDAEEDKARDGH
ncbi:hypothetical protein LCGC14_0935450 [marine sediment metagenome]|uniref:Uncharacterized protein n=1 Tax=marine sediment metagenome TaxID=412755 RepID=A0A0F9NR88_9ZZZZ